MTSSARWTALRWFRDHEIDINAVAGRRRPSSRMWRLMIREGQLDKRPVGSFGHARFVLTDAGKQLLASRRRARARDETPAGVEEVSP